MWEQQKWNEPKTGEEGKQRKENMEWSNISMNKIPNAELPLGLLLPKLVDELPI